VRPKTTTLAIVCAVAIAGLLDPGRRTSYGQEGNRKPPCGCYVCDTNPSYVNLEEPSKNCFGIVPMEACREEMANLPQSKRDDFIERVKAKRNANCPREGGPLDPPPPPVPAPLPPRPNATPSPEEPNCEAGSNVTPTMSIELAETLNIDKSPEMPDITATAKVTPSSTDVSWTAQITYKLRRCSGPNLPILDSPKVTGQGETFTPDFGAIYGGKLEITAKTTCGKGAETTITRDVGGLNADPSDVRNEIGTMDSPFDADDLKKIACHESHQRQFTSGNTATLGNKDDAGIMQICYDRRLDDIWNWKTNIARGRANLLSAAAFSRLVPLFTRRGYTVDGKGNKIPYLPRGATDKVENATNFTPEQLRLEAIKRYNAGNGPDVGYWVWDAALGGWAADPQGGGDPGYVGHVEEKSAACP
jgi:hypothetical protein